MSWKSIYVLTVLISVVTVSVSACTPETTPVPERTEAIPSAPSELVSLVAGIFATKSTGPAACAVSMQTVAGAKANNVVLQDPGGSGSFSFAPTSLTFKSGEPVNLTLKSESEFHTFTIDNVNQDGCTFDVGVKKDSTVILSFTFDNPGTYQFYCVPHISQGMVGTLVVE